MPGSTFRYFSFRVTFGCPIVLPLVVAVRAATQSTEDRDRTIRVLQVQAASLRKQLVILWEHKTGDLAIHKAAIEALIGYGFNSNQIRCYYNLL